tara:strand:- start:1230 stop:1445 length:216 start_codon:yes stop_codon:yes gene_type:complete
MKFEIGDLVKQVNTKATRKGKVIGIWNHDYYIENKDGSKILFAVKGEYKVEMLNSEKGNYQTFSAEQLIKA